MSAQERRIAANRVLAEALELPARERRAFVAESCGEDPELRDLVERLLVHAEEDPTLAAPTGLQDGTLWDGALASFAEAETTQTEDPQAGALVGRYRVLRELGRGGMAEVYLAERADGQFEQLVALKRIQLAVANEDGIRRFEQERNLLARIRHPHIAQLLDGGVDEQGRPFLVTEVVDGRPIDRYCDEERLPLKERLRLFLQVARAVDAAHRNLIIHRDLKPSNILVSNDGYAKLLDFGIAKSMRAEGMALTQADSRVMTPVYASPEQIRGEAVTTASDVYQLGLLLFLLLTGRWPYRLGQGTAGEVLRAAVEDEPTRPSAVIEDTGIYRPPTAGPSKEAQPGPARLRQTNRRRLRRLLAGDLDNIVLMALRKEPERRYRSVAQLIDDVERHLSGRPVAARPDTFLYRMGRLVRRYRAAVATGVAAVLLLISLATFYTLRVAEQRDLAQEEAAKANVVSEFMRGLFAIAAPTRSKGEQITAREMLDRGAERIDKTLGDQPELRADLMTLMGDVYRELALYEEAEPLLERAQQVYASNGLTESSDYAATLYARARLEEDTGKLEQAKTSYEQALVLQRSTPGLEDPAVARSLHGLGRTLEKLGEFDSAQMHLRDALAISENRLGPDDTEVGRILRSLGEVLKEVREHEAARPLIERALGILALKLGADHPEVADCRVLLGDVLRFTGEPEAALAQYESALPLVERAYGEDHPETAVVLTRLGNLLVSMDDFEGAVNRHTRALEIRRSALGPEHPRVASSLNNLGRIYSRQPDYAAAIPLFRESVTIYEASLGPDHPDITLALQNLAGGLRATGERIEAIGIYQRIVQIRERAYGPEHSLLAIPLLSVAMLQLDMGEAQQAEPLLRRALKVGRKKAPYRLPENIWPRFELGRCLTALARYEEAEEILLALVEEGNLDITSRMRTHRYLGDLYVASGRPEMSEEHYQELARLEALDTSI